MNQCEAPYPSEPSLTGPLRDDTWLSIYEEQQNLVTPTCKECDIVVTGGFESLLHAVEQLPDQLLEMCTAFDAAVS